MAWASGLAVAAPILGYLSYHLDGNLHPIIAAAATGVGAIFCLPAGFFKITKIFIIPIDSLISEKIALLRLELRHYPSLSIKCLLFLQFTISVW